MKVGFIVTSHWSDEYRPEGGEFITRFATTLKEHCNYDFNLYIVDNASSYTLPFFDFAEYIRIEDQTLEGITGAWNQGLHKAYSDGCNVLVNCNDDLWFNKTINILLKYIESHPDINAVYSSLSNGILQGSQKANAPKAGVHYKECKNADTVLNGFCFAMSREHYEKYRFTQDKYFNRDNKHNGGDGKWGGQEGQFIENSEKGLYGIVVNECWIPHTKVRGWKQLKSL
jgi:GT2 family glycosyltransferase